jgi:hypothetical protein
MKIEANGFWRRGVVFVFETVISEMNINETTTTRTTKGDVMNICQND